MLRPEAIMRGEDEIGPIQPYIPYSLEGSDLSAFSRPSDIETGTNLIQEIKKGYNDLGIKYSHEEMIASIIASLELSGDELAAIIPDQQDRQKVENTFLGLVYVGSKYFPGTFAKGMRTEYPEKPSYLKTLETEGIEKVVGTYHRILDAK